MAINKIYGQDIYDVRVTNAGSGIIISAGERTQITTNQTDIAALTSGYSRRKSVINIVDNTAVPPTEVSGDRYIIDDTGSSHANWDGAAALAIVEYDGASWVETTPLEGYVTYLDAQNKDALYVNDGSPAWEVRDIASTTHSSLTLDDGTNPHSTTKSDVGLANADNTSDADKPVSTATQTALDLKVDENSAITGATKTKITYDAKGLVTAGADATTADIADSTDARYVTDAQLVVIGNTSNTNSGDETDLTIGITATLTAGENVADKDLCYLKDDGKYWKADASAVATADTELVIATATILADATGEFRLSGVHTFTGLTVGAIYYVSTTAAGVTDTAPSGDNEVVRIIGYARSATELVLKPSPDYIEITTALADLPEYKESFTAGETVAIGDVCYLKSDGKMWKADASAVATTEGFLAIAEAAITAEAAGTFAHIVDYVTTGLTIGSAYYLSTTAAAITTTAPSGTGDVIRVLGYAKSVTNLAFNASDTFVEVA